ncbi:MAG: hypothetical protein C4296_10245 [Gemmataceae bacterium]
MTQVDHGSARPNETGASGGAVAAAAGRSPSRIRLALNVLWVRMRFILVLVGVGLVLVWWDTLTNLYEKWTRPRVAVAATGEEYFCPMHPNIVRDRPDKCPLCGMELSPRKKVEGPLEALPPGVLSRVQLTPYRVTLAGITTEPVAWRSLQRQMQFAGFVEFDETKLARLSNRLPGRSRIERLLVNVTGQPVRAGEPLALVYNVEYGVTVQNLQYARRRGDKQEIERLLQRLKWWGIGVQDVSSLSEGEESHPLVVVRAPLSGHVLRKYILEGDYIEEGARLFDVADLSTVWIESQVPESDAGLVRLGLPIRATTLVFPGRIFTGHLSFIHPHLDAATRTLRVRFDVANPLHELRPGMYATVEVAVPMAEVPGVRDYLEKQAASLAWRTPDPGAGLLPGPLDIMGLIQTASTWSAVARGYVLAVPEDAVVDTGREQIVYREAAPHVYEGVRVQAGPRAEGYVTILDGLHPGERIVVGGAFLVDAESRLQPAAGATYFGASGSHAGHAPQALRATQDRTDLEVEKNLSLLPAADRERARKQRFCPISGSPLGSMGKPVRIRILDETVYLCCDGCREQALAEPDKTWQQVQKFLQGAVPGK